MKCPRPGCTNEAKKSPQYGIIPCQKCQDREAGEANFTRYEFDHVAKQHRAQEQRDHFGQDMVQPFIRNKANPDFAKLYPKEAKQTFSKADYKEMAKS
jgi:hypothetical protein